jgi:hypothetical protein
VRVDWSPPEEHRGLGADVNEVIVNLVSTGSALAIAAAVKQFRTRFPRHKVEVEGDTEDDHAEPDDGGRPGRLIGGGHSRDHQPPGAPCHGRDRRRCDAGNPAVAGSCGGS